jgi:8-oxo-dGTP pyrophosphatase MutT (NUDIX family)
VPITSFGVIAFRINPQNIPEYLMICRKDTLGYIDFMRGKYIIQNKNYIMNMFKQMTIKEKEALRTHDFDFLWKKLWGNAAVSNQYKSEESLSKDKFNMLALGVLNKNELFSLDSIIEESNRDIQWTEPEWGFPKGRRNYQEKDFDCALREFCEETGYNSSVLKNIQNILPFEEIFTGSNYKSYKHKYYLMNVEYADSMNNVIFDKVEVSEMKWKTYDECILSIRPYNLEKKRMLTNIHHCLTKYNLFYGHPV